MENYHISEREFDELTVRFGAVTAEVEAADNRLHPHREQIRHLIFAAGGMLSVFWVLGL